VAYHKSAIKRIRQTEKRTKRNRFYKTRVKTVIKELRLAIASKAVEESEKALQKSIPLISKAASKGVLHKRNAARKISRLTKQVNFLKQSHQNTL